MHKIQRPKKVRSNLLKRLEFADDILSRNVANEPSLALWHGYAQHIKQSIK